MFRLQTKEQRAAARRIYIPKGPTVSRIALKDGSTEVYLYTTPRGGFLAMGFRGTAAKPAFHYSYRNEERRREAVEGFFASVRAWQAYRTERRAKQTAALNTLKVGDILYTSWGYDQTNVDFYAVTRVSGKRVYVRPIASDYEQTGFMSGRAWPAMPLQFTGPETWHLAQTYEGSTCLTIDGHHASLDTGRDHYTSSYA